MKIQKKNFAKASFAFLLCICLCGFFNYITLTFLGNVESHDTKRSILLFLVYFFQVQSALVAVFYGARLMTHRDDEDDEDDVCDFQFTSEMTPDEVSQQNDTKVVFFTIDGCLFNGIYHADKEKFCGYDGLDFPLKEVLVWCVQPESFAVTDKLSPAK